MKAILIDPVTEGIFEVDHDPHKWGDLHGWLSDLARGVEVRSDTYVTINKTNKVFVDEEGMLKNPKHFFRLRGARLPNGDIDHEPIAGRGLVLGCREKDGRPVDTTLTVDNVRALVTFGKRPPKRQE